MTEPPTALVHDLGCTEPCTCGAWDRAVEGDRDEAAESDEDDAG